MNTKIIRGILLLSILCSAFQLSAENIVFPSGVGVIDVTQAPYEADNTGAADATSAIQAAIDDHKYWQIIHLPNGTYTVSGTIRFPTYDTDQGNTGPILQGQSREGTVIRLASGTFTNPAAPQPVIITGNGVAQNFSKGLHNLTVRVGADNPGANGVYWYANNQGLMSDVDIVSEDGQGVVGLDLGYGEQGPCMAANIHVSGFDYGVKSDALCSVTLSCITLEGQRLYGVHNTNNALFIDSLTSINSVPAVYSHGVSFTNLTIINSRLLGGASDQPAVISENGGRLFARGIYTEGYQRAIRNSTGNAAPDERHVDEFGSHAPLSLHGSPLRSLNLPIKRPPAVAWEDDIAAWANIESYKGGLGQPQRTDAEALQAAIDAPGKTTVVIPAGKIYDLDDTVYVRGGIRRIIGTAGTFIGIPLVVADEPGSPSVVKIEKIKGLQVVQRSSRTVVTESFYGVVHANGLGDVFIVDACIQNLYVTNPGQHVWAWQFNSEMGDNNLTISAGTAWIFGWKTEGAWGTKVRATGGVVELVGFLQATTCEGNKDGIPVFSLTNTQFSVAGLTQTNFCDTWYTYLVEDIKGQSTETLYSSDNPNGYNLPLYTSYDSSWRESLLGVGTTRGRARHHTQPVTIRSLPQGRVAVYGAIEPRASASLLNAKGQIVMRREGPQLTPWVVDMSTRPLGAYVLRLHTGAGASRAVKIPSCPERNR